MSTRTRLEPFILPSIDMSAATTATTATLLQGLSVVNYALSWTGTSPVGTISLQFSDDYALDAVGQVLNAGQWNTAPIDVSGSIALSAPISGNTGNGMIDIACTGAYACRLLYTKGSGVGTLIPIVTGKVA